MSLTTTLPHVRAEFEKLRHRRSVAALLLVVPFLLAVHAVGSLLWARVDPGLYGPGTRALVAWPGPVLEAEDLLGSVGRLVACVLGALMVGVEFRADTWKMILPRSGSRGPFFVAKWEAGILALGASCALTAVVALMAYAAGRHVLADPAPSIRGVEVATAAVGVLGSFVESVFYFELGLLGALVTRSSLGGAVVAACAPACLYLLCFLAPAFALVLPNVHLQNVVGFTQGDAKGLSDAAAMFGREVDDVVSLLVVLGYIVALNWCGVWFLERRDFVSRGE